jgi:hypothetical protein
MSQLNPAGYWHLNVQYDGSEIGVEQSHQSLLGILRPM